MILSRHSFLVTIVVLLHAFFLVSSSPVKFGKPFEKLVKPVTELPGTKKIECFARFVTFRDYELQQCNGSSLIHIGHVHEIRDRCKTYFVDFTHPEEGYRRSMLECVAKRYPDLPKEELETKLDQDRNEKYFKQVACCGLWEIQNNLVFFLNENKEAHFLQTHCPHNIDHLIDILPTEKTLMDDVNEYCGEYKRNSQLCLEIVSNGYPNCNQNSMNELYWFRTVRLVHLCSSLNLWMISSLKTNVMIVQLNTFLLKP